MMAENHTGASIQIEESILKQGPHPTESAAGQAHSVWSLQTPC